MKSIRKLSAIMFTDIVGYTSMIGKDEHKAVETVTHHKKTIERLVPEFEGELIQFYGDGSLSIYQSATFALECAMKIQKTFQTDIKVPLRIGIHIGEILLDKGSIYGEGVNIASRIESLGQSGTILFSEDVLQTIRSNKVFKSQLMGEFEFKNVDKPMKVYALANKGLPIPKKESLSGKLKEVESTSPKTSPVAEHKSIAILPFVNMSSDPEQEFFCEGISEEIINTIVQLPDLTVAGRTSSFVFKGKNEDLRLVGDQLGVSKILEGSVRKSGKRIRITAQLIEVSTGFHLWSTKYDRELNDVFAIQDEISAAIAKQLEISLSGTKEMPKSRQQTKNVDAYQLYCKGRSLFYQRGTYLFEAKSFFKAALAIDPEYALAYSGLADTYVMLSFHGYLPPAECWEEAVPALQKAIEFGPELGETLNTKAVISLLRDYNLTKAEEEFKQALIANPGNIQARVWYAMFCLALLRGSFEESYKQFDIVLKTDPLSSYAYSCYGLVLTTMNKPKEAIAAAEHAVSLDSASLIALYSLCHTYLWSGQADKALQQCKMALKISNRHPWILHLRALAHVYLEAPKKAFVLLQEMNTLSEEEYFPPSNRAIVAAALGQDVKALALAQEAKTIGDPFLLFLIRNQKDGAALRNIPGFEQISQALH